MKNICKNNGRSLRGFICFFQLNALISLCLALSSCTSLFFQPTSQQYHDPEEFDYQPTLVSFVNKKGTRLYGWSFKTSIKSAQGNVIQFHGNAQNMSSHFLSLIWMVEHGYNLFTFDYSGYGISEGSPSQEDLYEDAQAAYRWLLANTPQDEPIIIYAQSLGVAVSVDAFPDFPQKERILSFVADSGFYSYQEIFREKMDHYLLTRLFQHLAYVLVSDEHSPAEKFQLISPIPLLIIHGSNDEVVGFNHAKKITELSRPPKTFWAVENGAHIEAMQVENGRYRKELLAYLARLKTDFPRK